MRVLVTYIGLWNPRLTGISVTGFNFEIMELLLRSFPDSKHNVKGFCLGNGVCEEHIGSAYKKLFRWLQRRFCHKLYK